MVEDNLERPHGIESDGLGAFDQAGSAAVRTFLINTAGQGGAQALASHLDDAELTHAQGLGVGPIVFHSFVQNPFDFAAVFGVQHIDEVADNQSAQVSQAKLADDFRCGLLVGVVSHGFGAAVGPRFSGVDVDGHGGLGWVNDY